MTLQFAQQTPDALPLHVVGSDDLDSFIETLTPAHAAWVRASVFSGAIGQSLVLPGEDGAPAAALIGYGTETARARARFVLAAAVPSLPALTFALAEGVPADKLEQECLGWLLTAYRFDRYKSQAPDGAALVAPEGVDETRVEILANAEALTRTLINTPAADMGPAELEASARGLADAHGASIDVTVGDALLEQNFPMIHAVGRAAEQEPRLIEMRWGDEGPMLTLVGKGVCFDTGGLNLKPGGSMGLMKKDMGGSATVLGLAQIIMASGWKVRLRVLIPAVENNVSGNSFRPGDILTARNGLTVEINNTDAEGRLVLADALAYGAEENPDLMLTMATLTGAARVAVGPDIAPFYTDDPALAQALISAGPQMADPVWQMPFHAPYEAMIEPGIADLDNAPSGGFAGSITAALFLRRFAGDGRYAHFDIYGWTPVPQPARPKGGVQQGVRALSMALPQVLGL